MNEDTRSQVCLETLRGQNCANSLDNRTILVWMPETLSPEDSKALLNLCRAGKLYEIEKWIAGGKSIRMPPQVKKPPLQVAMDLGFHSLVDLLVRNEDRAEVKNRALADAVERKRIDLVELLVAYGAEIR